MTEAELAAIEAFCKMNATPEQKTRLLERTIAHIQHSMPGIVSFDDAFIRACGEFDVPDYVVHPLMIEIRQARQCVEQ